MNLRCARPRSSWYISTQGQSLIIVLPSECQPSDETVGRKWALGELGAWAQELHCTTVTVVSTEQ